MAGPQAPSIPGLSYRGFLGSGGFADVYLYESTNPVRKVAVKVLRDKSLGPQWVRRFANEANTMAALEHPYIVRVYSSGLTDDGRPYIEMAYYPEETLARAVKREPLPVPEVLRIGVQLASAVEAAHQVGLLHRDIKPANVLVDKFGDPALTDFGIASQVHEVDSPDASLSVPWAPPEAMFATAALDRRGDIYSLAATLWHLLVGHSPFEVPGGDNKPNSMMVRVRDLPVPSTGRGDVPDSLERLLKQAMSKDPRLRPATAADFARALNAIEEELRLRPTPFKVARQTEMPTPLPMPSADDGTRIRGLAVSVNPDADGTRLRGGPQAQISGAMIQPHPAREDATRLRPVNPVALPLPDDVDVAPAEPKKHRWRVLIGILVLVLVAAGVTAWILLAPKPTPPPTGLPTVSVSPGDGLGNVDTWPGVPVITSQLNGGDVTFSWTYTYPDPSDGFLVTLPDNSTTTVQDPHYSLPYNNQPVCITVEVRRASGAYISKPSELTCYPS